MPTQAGEKRQWLDTMVSQVLSMLDPEGNHLYQTRKRRWSFGLNLKMPRPENTKSKFWSKKCQILKINTKSLKYQILILILIK